MLRPYSPEPLTDFTREGERSAFAAALEHVKTAYYGKSYPMHIDGADVTLADTMPSLNPSRPAEVVAHFPHGDATHADAAIAAASRAFPAWARLPVGDRAGYLLRAAAQMRRRKHEFSAIMVYEVGKSWAEADADTAEAIDFMDYYARQALRITDSSDLLTPYPPEHLTLTYIPLGVGAIIPPWNFANAIPAGMVAAALVTGNTVVFKPAEQSPLIAYVMAGLFWEQGIPAGVLNFITGDGEIVGERMVAHPQTRFIAFTGSKAVGLHINEVAAKVQPGQKWLKRAILEMGGKDAVLVDETADLSAAAQGIVDSAFGFQGQKCSAGSRAILVDAIYDQIVPQIVERAARLTVGAPDDSVLIDQGPVIDVDAMKRIMDAIELGTQEGTLLLGGSPLVMPEGGYFIPPTVFGDVPPDAHLAQDEIFGPVLALIRARDFDHALEIANNTDYGLTGAVFSSRRDRLDQARESFHVGNLYLNRKCTGALVGVHPFGGFNMSGTDSKAGGPDYLLLYTQAKLVAERL
ncbi:MAG: L-glutamate gamma-semialdehyde dehydrogenase [Chloroflexota bacterium]|nr:L-glutamate gamma-semialdehyde dehydrogenase [Chloroflexota bacterium]